MGAILLHNLDTLATFDEEHRRLAGAWVLIRDNRIEAVGPRGTEPEQANQRIDLAGHVALPGLVNTQRYPLAQALVARCEKRCSVNLARQTWRRAYPYEPRVGEA